jgi:uncharacterized protein YndB with AHSA1/START domain
MTTSITAEKGKQDIWIERSFNANKNLVFRLLTEEDLIIQWQVQPFTFKTFEGKNGGIYESTHIGPDGNTYGFKGVFHEIIPNERIIKTSEFIGLPFKVIPTLEIHSVEEINRDQTKLTIQIICNNEEVRDAMVQHGMQQQFDTLFLNLVLLLDKDLN